MDDNMQMIEFANGSIIEQPAFVLVRPTSESHRDVLRRHSLVPEDVVVAIGIAKNKEVLSLGSKKPTLQVSSHMIELAFSLTYWKLQGITCKTLVLDLNTVEFCHKCKITANMLYVGISRVQKVQDLQILPLIAGKSLQFLKSLKVSSDYTNWIRQVPSPIR
jgi:hypothetical protein